MATIGIYYKLSKLQSADGRCEIIARINVNRNYRPQISTGIYVHPKYFNEGLKDSCVIVPARMKSTLRNELQDIKDSLQKWSGYVCRIIEAYSRNVTREEILHILSLINEDNIQRRLLNGGNADDLAESSITEAKIKELLIAEEQTLKAKEKCNIYQLAEEYISKKNYVYSTEKKIRVLFRCMRRYELYRQAIFNDNFVWDIDKVTREDIEDFRDYFRNEKTLSDEHPKLFAKLLEDVPADLHTARLTKKLEERGQTATVEKIKKFKAFWCWLIENDKTTNNPFDKVKIGAEQKNKVNYITVEERDLIADYDLSKTPSLELQRDIFVFQCLVGCRVSDLYSLTEKQINDGVLSYVPHKTKDSGKEQIEATVPLSNRAKRLIEKYRGKDTKGRLFPFISQQKYNDAIKRVFKECGITRNVNVINPVTGEPEVKPICEIASSHMARKTFVSSVYRNVRDQSIVGAMSGHSEKSKAFSRYRNIETSIMQDAIAEIDKSAPTEAPTEADLQSLSKEELIKLLLNK